MMQSSSPQTSFFDPFSTQPRPQGRIVGNDRLVPYGILTEKSDFRVHVGYLAKRVFLFTTKEAQRIVKEMQQRKFKPADSYQFVGNQRILTARGMLVPLGIIGGLEEIIIPDDLYRKCVIVKSDSTSQKGRMAVMIVLSMLERGLLRFPIVGKEVHDINAQVKDGADVIAYMNWTIQVKSDYACGTRNHHDDCTGNVYLQTHECNPDKRF